MDVGRFARGLEEIEAILEGVIAPVVNSHFAEGAARLISHKMLKDMWGSRVLIWRSVQIHLGSQPRGLPCPPPPLPPPLDNKSTSSTAVRKEECESEEESEGEECEEEDEEWRWITWPLTFGVKRTTICPESVPSCGPLQAVQPDGPV